MDPDKPRNAAIASAATRPPPCGPLRSVPAAAREVGISRSRLYELLAEGRLRAVKLGGRTLVPDSKLRAFVAALPPAVFGAGKRRGGR